ncbi:MAG: MlaD family protein, partial [Mycobacterium sp.]
MTRQRFTAVLAALLAVLLAGGALLLYRNVVMRPNKITAYFTSATAIYPGDQVRVAGVKVGSIKSIEPLGTKAKMTLAVDRKVPIPADAKAVVIADNLVGARYVQLAPSYIEGES